MEELGCILWRVHGRRPVNRVESQRSMRLRVLPGNHGTRSRYVAGCRCDDCTDAEARYSYARWVTKRRSKAGPPGGPGGQPASEQRGISKEDAV